MKKYILILVLTVVIILSATISVGLISYNKGYARGWIEQDNSEYNISIDYDSLSVIIERPATGKMWFYYFSNNDIIQIDRVIDDYFAHAWHE